MTRHIQDAAKPKRIVDSSLPPRNDGACTTGRVQRRPLHKSWLRHAGRFHPRFLSYARPASDIKDNDNDLEAIFHAHQRLWIGHCWYVDPRLAFAPGHARHRRNLVKQRASAEDSNSRRYRSKRAGSNRIPRPEVTKDFDFQIRKRLIGSRLPSVAARS